MNNLVSGKTMENLRNRVDVKIVRDWETDKIRKLVSCPSFDRFTIFGNDMASIHMHKTKLMLNRSKLPIHFMRQDSTGTIR